MQSTLSKAEILLGGGRIPRGEFSLGDSFARQVPPLKVAKNSAYRERIGRCTMSRVISHLITVHRSFIRKWDTSPREI